MREIQLTQGHVAIVDNEDFEFLSQFKWHAHRNRYTYYAETYKRGSKKRIKMHRAICGFPELRFVVDHINGNGLDNRRANLRVVPRCINSLNAKLPKK